MHDCYIGDRGRSRGRSRGQDVSMQSVRATHKKRYPNEDHHRQFSSYTRDSTLTEITDEHGAHVMCTQQQIRLTK